MEIAIFPMEVHLGRLSNLKYPVLAALIILAFVWTAPVKGEPVSGVLPGETRFDSQFYSVGQTGTFTVSPFVLDPAEIARVDLRLFYPTTNGRLVEAAWIRTYYEEPLYVPANEYFPIEIGFNVSTSGGIVSGPVYYMTVVDLRRAGSSYYVGYYSMTSLAFRVENPEVPSYSSLQDLSRLCSSNTELVDENVQLRSVADNLQNEVYRLLQVIAGLTFASVIALTVATLLYLRKGKRVSVTS